MIDRTSRETELSEAERVALAKRRGLVPQLIGHDSPETAYRVEDWPYGRTLRCVKRFWVETAASGAKKGQQRIVSQTTNPKFEGERWNKPKRGTYSDLIVMLLDEEGKVTWDHASMYDTERLSAFVETYGAGLSDSQLKRLAYVQGFQAVMSKVTWTIREAGLTEAERAAADEEQARIGKVINRGIAVETHKAAKRLGV
jgi:hypothetical protein